MTIERKVKKWMIENAEEYPNATLLAEAAADEFAVNTPDEDIPEWVYELSIDILPVD